MSQNAPTTMGKRRKLFYYTLASGFILLVAAGIFAKNGWFPSTDRISGKRIGWFGQTIAKNAPSSWSPIASPPDPTPLPLTKEYIYAGSRLLAVEDANANAGPPADLAIWRPSDGYWWVLGGPGSQFTTQQWGMQGDKPVPGDYDGDGKTDFAVYRPSNGYWFIIESSTGNSYSFGFGNTSDIPLAADFDGDGKSNAALFRENTPSSGQTSFIVRRPDGSTYNDQFGINGDKPAPADFDGDGKVDYGVWRDTHQTFYSRNSTNGNLVWQQLDVYSTRPVPGDYDGDGKADYAARPTGSNNWVIYLSGASSLTTIAWQNSTDEAVQNDYDGDGKVDIATWRDSNGTWYIRQSSLIGQSNELRQVQWGMHDDVPVPAYFRR